MLEIILAFISSLLIVVVAIPSVIKVSYLKHLYDVPDERKSHDNVIPTLGGLAIFAGFMISSSLCITEQSYFNYNYLVGALMIIFFIGIKDDILITAPIKKLLGQLLAAVILVVLGGVRITSMYGFLGVEELRPEIASTLTVFTLVVIMNGFNLIDGINWLSAGVSIIVSSALGAWFYLTGHVDLAVISASLVGSLLGFLWFNKTPAKIFMGDTGSLIIGLIIGVQTIFFIQLSPNSTWGINSVPIVAFGILIVPLFDTLRVFIFRALNGKSPLNPDKNHIHHKLLELGFSHMKSSILIMIFNALFIVLVYSLRNIGGLNLLAVEVCIAGLFSFIPSIIIRRNNDKRALQVVHPEQEKKTKKDNSIAS
ncbi:undecaprenyl/decaprenyl-phosphate alpha-N-acetylglucosaminyl 1-phosphate transferase [Flavobacteriales bacterium]|nr:undecaprenyl/decaprenyl-phosphate alpha-N-acetylglucosaminyl 1-phosphate transferase [Flavobacteriales bacterium]